MLWLHPRWRLLVVVKVQQTYLVLQQVALRVVLEYRAGSGPLSLHVGDLLPVQAHVLLQQILYLPTCAVREVGDRVRLVEDPTRVLPVRRKVVRYDAVDLKVPAYL